MDITDFLKNNQPTSNKFESIEWKKFTKDLIYFRKDCFVQIIKARLKELLIHIAVYPGEQFQEKIFNYVNGYDIRKCPCCESLLKFRRFSSGYSIHCSKKCSRNNPLTLEKEKITNLMKYGTENVMQCKQIKDTYKKSMMDKYGSESPFASDQIKIKIKETKIKNGTIIADEDKSDFDRYKSLVNNFTKNQPLHLLVNHEKRGQGKDFFSLDHRYSIKQGFIDLIDPEIIGNIVNLEYINVSKNSSKQAKCSIGKEELLSSYSINTNN